MAAHRAVCIDEQLHIAAPGGRRCLARREPVGACERKSAALFAKNPAADRVLPIGRVEHVLPDVVAIGMRAPQRLSVRQPADRAAEVGTVPRLAVEALIDNAEQRFKQRIVHCHQCANLARWKRPKAEIFVVIESESQSVWHRLAY